MLSFEPIRKIFGCFITASITRLPDISLRRHSCTVYTLGLIVRDLDRQTAERLELPKQTQGVLITRVEPMSSSFDGGIERGTVLLELNRQRVESVAE